MKDIFHEQPIVQVKGFQEHSMFRRSNKFERGVTPNKNESSDQSAELVEHWTAVREVAGSKPRPDQHSWS